MNRLARAALATLFACILPTLVVAQSQLPANTIWGNGTAAPKLPGAYAPTAFTFLQSGTGAVNRGLVDQLKEVYTPAQFQAACDGTTNDTAKLSAMFLAASGKRVVFEAGKTCISDPIVISQTNANVPAVIEGNGATIKARATSSSPTLTIENPHGVVLGNAIRNLKIDADSKHATGLYVHGAQYMVLDNVVAKNATGSACSWRGEPGFGIYYLAGNIACMNSAGVGFSGKSINNSGGYYIAFNSPFAIKSQFNTSYGFDLDYMSGAYYLDGETNGACGLNVDHTIDLVLLGLYQELNNSPDASICATANTKNFHVKGGRLIGTITSSLLSDASNSVISSDPSGNPIAWNNGLNFNGGGIGMGGSLGFADAINSANALGFYQAGTLRMTLNTGLVLGSPTGGDQGAGTINLPGSGGLYYDGVKVGGTINSGTGGRLAWYSSTGTSISGNANVTASNGDVTFGVAGSAQGSLTFAGSTSGGLKLKGPAAAGSNTLTFPAGTTDFSSTGGTSRVVKQTSAGGAFTVARLACADLSDAAAGCSGASVSGANPTATIGLSAVNGSATTYLRSDGAPALSQAIVPTWTGVHTHTVTQAANTSADGVVLEDATAASSGNQQYSPRLRWTGRGWKTDATAASQTVDWVAENRPAQGTASPTSNLVFQQQINGGGYTTKVQFTTDGIQLPGGFGMGGSVPVADSFNSANSLTFLIGGASEATIDGDGSVTGTNTALRLTYNNGSIQRLGRVSVGAADSCTAGFRCLRVPN